MLVAPNVAILSCFIAVDQRETSRRQQLRLLRVEAADVKNAPLYRMAPGKFGGVVRQELVGGLGCPSALSNGPDNQGLAPPAVPGCKHALYGCSKVTILSLQHTAHPVQPTFWSGPLRAQQLLHVGVCHSAAMTHVYVDRLPGASQQHRSCNWNS